MVEQGNTLQDPHQGYSIQMAGEPLARARAAMILLHGRGARAEDILTLAGPLALPGYAFLAPQAVGGAWYPNRFLAPLESNEPWLSSALGVVGELLAEVENAGIPAARTILLGFSQGGCLALEYAARHGQHYGGVAGLSGALIGPPGTQREAPTSLDGTPVFLGCSDVDPHVPKDFILATADALTHLNANVTLRLYPQMDHIVNQDEVDFVREMMAALVPSG